jgi:molybdopterin converting factor small subunit
MLADGALTLREFAMQEPLPLATVHGAILAFLQNRKDAVVFGAQAVNAYIDEPRMTQDVDILSTAAEALAEELREWLNAKFNIAVRVRSVAAGVGFRVYQVAEPKNRHLADVRQVAIVPPSRLVEGVLVPVIEELIAQKVIAYTRRKGQPKSGTDWRDIAELLLSEPKLKAVTGPVHDRLLAAQAEQNVLDEWERIVATEIAVADDDGY